MSIVVAVRVGEGLVLAADSASALQAPSGDGQTHVAKVFNHATKLLQLRDFPIGVATWGAGNLGARTISSLINEHANSRTPLRERAKEDSDAHEPLDVQEEAKELMGFLYKWYEQAFPEWEQAETRPGIGVLVGGYSGKKYFPEEYVFNVPDREFLPLREPGEDGAQSFGANWYGLTDAIVRLHHGRDDRWFQALEQVGVTSDKIQAAKELARPQLEYPVPFGGMPLQDAVDYANYLVGVVVGRYRFVAGPEVCGGPIDVAAITREGGFSWVQHKEIEARPFGP